MRLLACYDCVTLELLPDYEGPPEYDVLLDTLADPHKFPNGEEHKGNLFRISQADWDKIEGTEGGVRKHIAKEVYQFQLETASLRDTFKEDALKCFSKHGRPKQGCIDYKDDSKRIGNPAKYGSRARKIFLCEWCPVHTWVTTEIRHRKGMYRG